MITSNFSEGKTDNLPPDEHIAIAYGVVKVRRNPSMFFVQHSKRRRIHV